MICNPGGKETRALGWGARVGPGCTSYGLQHCFTTMMPARPVPFAYQVRLCVLADLSVGTWSVYCA